MSRSIMKIILINLVLIAMAMSATALYHDICCPTVNNRYKCGPYYRIEGNTCFPKQKPVEGTEFYYKQPICPCGKGLKCVQFLKTPNTKFFASAIDLEHIKYQGKEPDGFCMVDLTTKFPIIADLESATDVPIIADPQSESYSPILLDPMSEPDESSGSDALVDLYTNGVTDLPPSENTEKPKKKGTDDQYKDYGKTKSQDGTEYKWDPEEFMKWISALDKPN